MRYTEPSTGPNVDRIPSQFGIQNQTGTETGDPGPKVLLWRNRPNPQLSAQIRTSRFFVFWFQRLNTRTQNQNGSVF